MCHMWSIPGKTYQQNCQEDTKLAFRACLSDFLNSVSHQNNNTHTHTYTHTHTHFMDEFPLALS